jgi:hypothetical protein
MPKWMCRRCNRVERCTANRCLSRSKPWRRSTCTACCRAALLGKALHYVTAQWRKVVRYLEDGRYPVDNNACENAIRPFVVGRRNWLFANTVAGANASANLYSLLQTCLANRIDGHQYLKALLVESSCPRQGPWTTTRPCSPGSSHWPAADQQVAIGARARSNDRLRLEVRRMQLDDVCQSSCGCQFFCFGVRALPALLQPQSVLFELCLCSARLTGTQAHTKRRKRGSRSFRKLPVTNGRRPEMAVELNR